MGRRGPKPKPPAERKMSRPVGVRLPLELSQRLEAAAKERNVNLSREIQDRLEESFRYGGWATTGLLLRIADGIAELERNHGARWWDSRFTFDECVAFINDFMNDWKPRGKSIRPKKRARDIVLLGRHVAEFERVRTLRGPHAIVLQPKITRQRQKSEMRASEKHQPSWARAFRRALEKSK